jgi:hypothetical protein
MSYALLEMYVKIFYFLQYGPTIAVCVFVCFYVRPRQATDVPHPAGLLYRPL